MHFCGFSQHSFFFLSIQGVITWGVIKFMNANLKLKAVYKKKCTAAKASSPGPSQIFFSQQWRKIGRRPGIKTTSRTGNGRLGLYRSFDPRPSPNFSPRPRDKIWVEPGYEAKAATEKNYLGTRRVTQHSSVSVVRCLRFVPVDIGVQVNGARAPRQALLLVW